MSNHTVRKWLHAVAITSVVPLLALTPSLHADESCESAWIPTFGAYPGTHGTVHAIASFDAGNGEGPSLYIGGTFSWAGGQPASRPCSGEVSGPA